MPETTPARESTPPGAHDLHWLAETAGSYADGGEDYVIRVLERAADRRQLSDELADAARTWPERYHLARGRANLLRPLEIPANTRALEIGSGCGAVTGYLAENCAVVDAVEPEATRARATRARTRGIGDVAVFVGSVGDLPETPAYDLAVVVGVLEYVGAGTDSPEPYTDFLRALRTRLAPGGTLVLAIENQLGVKYLAGAPEDHTGGPWDGINNYRGETRARTFTRPELIGLLGLAGFAHVRVLSAFPDYKLTQAILTDELLAGWPDLAAGLPKLPSPDWAGGSARPVDEQVLWHKLVGAGSGAVHGNSFVVVAGMAEPSPLWPEHRLGATFDTERERRRCTQAFVERGEGAPQIAESAIAGLP